MQTDLERRVDQVIVVLGELKRLYDELSVVVKAKLDGMRQADTDAMRSASTREGFLTQKITEQDGLRKQLLDCIGEWIQVPDRPARSMTVRELAERVSEPQRSRLLGLAAGLKLKLRETADTNRVATLVAHEMMKHFRHVYEVMAEANETHGVYSYTGRTETKPGRAVFDAVV